MRVFQKQTGSLNFVQSGFQCYMLWLFCFVFFVKNLNILHFPSPEIRRKIGGEVVPSVEIMRSFLIKYVMYIKLFGWKISSSSWLIIINDVWTFVIMHDFNCSIFNQNFEKKMLYIFSIIKLNELKKFNILIIQKKQKNMYV